jgi:hypothetical protein
MINGPNVRRATGGLRSSECSASQIGSCNRANGTGFSSPVGQDELRTSARIIQQRSAELQILRLPRISCRGGAHTPCGFPYRKPHTLPSLAPRTGNPGTLPMTQNAFPRSIRGWEGNCRFLGFARTDIGERGALVWICYCPRPGTVHRAPPARKCHHRHRRPDRRRHHHRSSGYLDHLHPFIQFYGRSWTIESGPRSG